MAEQTDEGRQPHPPERPAEVVTQHSLTLDGETVDYTATVGSIDVSIGDHAGRIFYCRLANLRIDQSRFRKALLRDDRRVLGRYDTRYSSDDLEALDDFADYDPTNAAINGAFTAAINEYLVRNLGVEKAQPYVTLSDTAIGKWEWRPGVAGYNKAYYIDAARNLRDAMIRNPCLRVFFVGGQHDLATPFYAAEYTVAHMNLPAKLRAHVEFGVYASGHMVYLRDAEQQALNRDMQDFMQRAIDRQTAEQAGPFNPGRG